MSSRLGYEFAPIDVNIITHPRVADVPVKDRHGAFGLWCWGQCFARLHARDGHLRRSVVLTSFGAPPNLVLRLAALLVLCGLWIEREDLSWDIRNFVAKATGKTAAERQRRYRERKRDGVTSRVTDTVITRDASRVADISPSYSSSVSKSSSPEEIQSPEAEPSAREGPPDWFAVDVVATLETNGVAVTDIAGRWVEYEASRIRKGWPMTPKDAASWLVAVMRSEKTRAKTSGGGRGAEITKQPHDPEAPWLKAAGGDP